MVQNRFEAENNRRKHGGSGGDGVLAADRKDAESECNQSGDSTQKKMITHCNICMRRLEPCVANFSLLFAENEQMV